MKKEYVIGGIALAVAASIGGFLLWKSKNKKTTKEDVKPTDPLEGKNIALKGSDGNYGGGAIYLIKNGEKLWYGNNQFEAGYGLNWDKYCLENPDCNKYLLLVPQSDIDKYPDAPKVIV